MSNLKTEVMKRFKDECEALSSLERARMKEALDWALGFIRCNVAPEALSQYPDFSNLEHLASGMTFGPFQFVLAQNELMLKTIQQAEDACRDNLKMFHYKNEQMLLNALKECEKWTKPRQTEIEGEN